MEHFRNAKVVRLLSRHDKYLTADDDSEDGVRQHRSGASRGAKWKVELVEGRTDVIRLKSCSFNRYLAASEKRFLLGATGRKVVLLPVPSSALLQGLREFVEWQPVRDGTRSVKLRTKAGTFLRANGFVKPYGNTVTHGNPHRTVTQDWVLWEVDVIEMVDNATAEPPSTGANAVVAPSSPYPYRAGVLTPGRTTDQRQSSAGFSTGRVLAALASVGGPHSRRSSSAVSDASASSCMSEEEAGYTPSPRSQAVSSPTRPTRLRTSSIENIFASTATPRSSADSSSTVSSGVGTPESSPPRRTTVRGPSSPRRIPSPHSSPPRRMPSSVSSPPQQLPSPVSSPPRRKPTLDSSSPRKILTPASSNIISPTLSRKESSGGGRLVVYYFADDDGGVDDSFPSGSFEFNGCSAKDLIHNVEIETGLDEFILCRRNVINDKLYRLRVNVPLPPDRAPMTVFIVHPMSKVAKHIF